VTVFPFRSAGVVLASVLTLSSCSSLSDTFSGDKIDYRSSNANTNKNAGLEVPPDLTQLPSDNRYQVPVSASSTAAAVPVSASPKVAVAAQSIGNVRIERQGNQRWLITSATPEQLWLQLLAFWEERKLVLVSEQAELGTMETDWAENRAKLPLDFLRKNIGKALDSLYSTGELDKFRLRVERTANGSEIYLTHRGFEEIYTGSTRDQTKWQPRPRDPQLEAEMLSLLMVKLGSKPEQAKAELTKPEPAAVPANARIVAQAKGSVLQVDDNFDRAWRRVGIALDRSGFTVEDRDRAQGLYFVRYVDPATAGKEEKGFLSKLFGKNTKDDKAIARYRINVKSEGGASMVAVLDNLGAPETGEVNQRIVQLLLDELK
jgi:outer membrane protein assembly factor BamC